ncbi:MAG TPA: hypothetical protein VFJ12_14700 [Segeticoccus sp.]|nr:hypothetical protein [Segeticoccus sp.]
MPDPRPNSDIEELLRRRDWVEDLSPVDLDRLAGRARRRVQWPTAIVAAAAVVAILGGIVGGASLLRRPGHPAQPAASSGSGGTVPWVNTPASEVSPATPSDCQPGDLQIALGSVGVWQGQSLQVLDVTNTSGMPCSFPPQALSVTATTPAGRQVGVDQAANQDAVALSAGQTAHVGIGAPADCGSAPTIARTLEVKMAGGAAHSLDKAWLPVNCGRPSVVQVSVDTAASAASEPLTVTVHAPAAATAGSTLRFTVTLTDTSTSESVKFADCPSYYMGLKAAQVDEGYQLNCDVNPDLAPGESRTYEMQMAVPDGAAGSDVLTWYLGGHAATDSVPIDVH